MGRKETVELTNMCMVEDGKGNVLVQNRLDPNWSGIVYPGGHVEAWESITASVIREIREETGQMCIRDRCYYAAGCNSDGGRRGGASAVQREEERQRVL